MLARLQHRAACAAIDQTFPRVSEAVIKAMGVTNHPDLFGKFTIHHDVGGYENQVSPSMTLEFDPKEPLDTIKRNLHNLGYVFHQDSTLLENDELPPKPFVDVLLKDPNDADQVRSVWEKIQSAAPDDAIGFAKKDDGIRIYNLFPPADREGVSAWMDRLHQAMEKANDENEIIGGRGGFHGADLVDGWSKEAEAQNTLDSGAMGPRGKNGRQLGALQRRARNVLQTEIRKAGVAPNRRPVLMLRDANKPFADTDKRVADVKAAATNLVEQFHDRPELVVHNDRASATPEAKAALDDVLGDDHDAPPAMYLDGKMHVFADQVKSPAQLEQAVMHEMVHYGLRKVFGRPPPDPIQRG